MTQTYFSPATLSLDLTLSGADLVITTAPNRSSNVSGCLSYNQLPASTKTYFEITHTSGTSGSDSGIGVGEASATYYGLGNNGTSGAIIFSTGHIYVNGSNVLSGPTWTIGTTVGIAVDTTANLIWFTSNGTTWNAGGSASPATGVGGVSISALSSALFAAVVFSGGTTEKVTGNFGASAFSYSVPSGFASGIPFTQEYSYTTLAISKALQYDILHPPLALSVAKAVQYPILNPPLALSVAKMVQYVIFNSSPASNFFFAA